MRKRSFLTFALLALLLGVIVPLWIFSADGSGSGVDESDEGAMMLFVNSCGSCHTLEAAGTDGVVGPDLDELLGGTPPESNVGRVESAILEGREGRMPAGILQGEQATIVADYVARVAGQ